MPNNARNPRGIRLRRHTMISERRFVTEKEAAAIGSFPLQTLRNWRHLGKGPVYTKVGRSVRYPLDDLYKYFDARRIDPENVENGG